MMAVKAFIKTHSVLIFYALAFTISWGCLLLVIGGPSRIPGTPAQFEKLIPLAGLALIAGPSVSGILLTGLVCGRMGLRGLIARLLRWRLGAHWYAVSLLVAPVLMTALPLALSFLSSEFLPGLITKSDRTGLLLMGIAFGLMAGIFEELGWTGFAIPRLRLRYGVLSTGLIVGFLWGAWHLLVNFWSSGASSGGLSLSLLLHSVLFSIGVLPAFRVLMVWVYDHTGSLLVAVLMHTSLTSSNVILVPSATGGFLVTWSLLIAAGLWAVVVTIVMVNRGRLS